MKPEIDTALRVLAEKLVTEIAPAAPDRYMRSNLEVAAGLLMAAAEESDRAAEIRITENRALRSIFADAAPRVADAALRERLEDVVRQGDPGLRVSELNAANDRLRRLLIELHALVETLDEDWARRTNAAIWQELRAGAARRALSFFPL